MRAVGGLTEEQPRTPRLETLKNPPTRIPAALRTAVELSCSVTVSNRGREVFCRGYGHYRTATTQLLNRLTPASKRCHWNDP
jgi:hypothetical protein